MKSTDPAARSESSSGGPEPGPGAGLAGSAGPTDTGRWILLAALLLGLLRFFRLGHFGLWLDEALTWTDYHFGLDDGMIGNPLGYRLIGGFVQLIGGEPSEWSLRFLPAVFGFLAIGLAYWALHPGVGRRAAAIGALLLAVSPWQLYWSQTARFYTMAQVMTLIGGGLFLRAVLAPHFSRVVLIKALFGIGVIALGLLFHITSLLVVGGVLSALFVTAFLGGERARELRRVLPGLLVFVVVFGLLMQGNVRYWLEQYLRHNDAANPKHFLMTLGYYLTPILGTAFVLSALELWRQRPRGALLVGLIGAAVCAAGIAASFVGTVSAQYVLVGLPWITAAVGWGIAQLPGPRLRLAGLALLVLPALTGCALYFSVHGGNRPAWREAYALVAEERRPTDLVFGMAAPVGEFYLRSGSARLRNPIEVLWLTSFTARAGLVEEWTRRPRRIWFVVREEIFQEFDPNDSECIQRFLREDCRLAGHFPSNLESRDLSVAVYVRD